MKIRRIRCMTAVACAVVFVLCIPLTVSAQTHGKLDPKTGMIRVDGDIVVRAMIRNADDLQFMLAIAPDVWSESYGIGPVDFHVPADNIQILQQSGIQYEVLIPDLQGLIDAERDRIDKHRGGVGLDDQWYTTYHPLDELMTYMDDLAAAYPDLASVSTIGMSLENRPIRALHITGAGGPDRPTVVIESNQHAREWVTPPCTMYIAEFLLTNYGTDPVATELVDSLNIHMIITVNPDGYNYTWTNYRLWRKNRRDNGNGTWGVDLNRNWSTGWGGPGSSGDPNSETYRGPAPFSEPETTVVRDFLNNLPRLEGFIDYHSYGQLVLEPWGYTSDLPPDYDTFQYVGGLMDDAASSLYNQDYVHGPTYTTIYPASGTAGDWPYEQLGTLSFGMEMRDTGRYGFLLPEDQILPTAQEALAAFIELAAYTTTQLRFRFPDGLPTIIEPDTVNSMNVAITGINGGTYKEDSGKLWARVGTSGDFVESALVPLGNDLFEATFPSVPCEEVVQYYFEAQSTDGATVRSPDDAPIEYYEATAFNVETYFTDNFETDKGWSIENINLTDGAWERGVPAGDGSRGDPTSDYDGSGSCYLTANRGGNSDVDGGPTRLTSPAINLAGADAVVNYARWFYNDDNDGDSLDIEVSNDGGNNWTLVESVGNTGGWQPASFRVSDYVTPTSNTVIRFSATDNPNDSVTEAAIDAIDVKRTFCGGGGDCLTLGIDNLVGGQDATFTVTDAGAGSTVAVLYGTALGQFVYNQGGWCVDFGIKIPPSKALSRIVVQGAADGNGDFVKSKRIPGVAKGLQLHFQAAQKDTCPDPCMSNVVTETVQ